MGMIMALDTRYEVMLHVELIDTGREASPDMVEGDIHHRGVDDLDEGGEHDGERDNPFVHLTISEFGNS